MREKSKFTTVARDLPSMGCTMNQNFLSLLDKKLPNGAVSHALEVPLGGTCVSRKDALYTVVGASVAVCLIDTETAWCSLRQVMLPSLARGHRQDAMLQADAALLQGLATARASGGAAPGQGPFAIEHDPLTGQASVRLPLPDPQVLQQMARALAP